MPDTPEERAAALTRELAAARTEATEVRREFERVLAHSADFYFKLDRDWRFTFVNAALLRAMAEHGGPTEPHQVVGHPIAEIIPAAEHTGFRARYAQAAQEQRPLDFEEHYTPFDRWFAVHVWPTPEGLSVQMTDITARKRAEAAHDRDQRLESLGLLAAGVAHDFNNLLSAIQGNLALARLDRPDRATRLDAADDACARAAELARRMLTFARGGAPNKRAADVRAALEENARFAAQGSPVRVDIEAPSDLRQADADPTQLGQVIQNLVLNAVQAMPGGGVVTIAASNVGEGVAFTVSDTGPGIPPAHLAQVFDPFFTTKPAGTGLGLATAWSIVRRHGGTLEVASTSPAGTTMRVWLPSAFERPEPVFTPMPPPRFPGRVLVMDDDAAVREVLSGCLDALGYEVEAVSNGEEAVARYAAAKSAGLPFDAVVLDLTVPGGLGGVATLQALRSVEPSVVAVVTSGYSDGSVLAEATTHGFASSLAKPFSLEDVARALAAAGV